MDDDDVSLSGSEDGVTGNGYASTIQVGDNATLPSPLQRSRPSTCLAMQPLLHSQRQQLAASVHVELSSRGAPGCRTPHAVGHGFPACSGEV